MSIEKTYLISFVEVVRHTATLQARSEKAARTLVRRDWTEVGAEAFRQETLGMCDLISVEEVRP
jgi:hypothetical protein